MSRLWHDVDKAIVFPRMDVEASSLLSIRANEVSTRSHTIWGCLSDGSVECCRVAWRGRKINRRASHGSPETGRVPGKETNSGFVDVLQPHHDERYGPATHTSLAGQGSAFNIEGSRSIPSRHSISSRLLRRSGDQWFHRFYRTQGMGWKCAVNMAEQM